MQRIFMPLLVVFALVLVAGVDFGQQQKQAQKRGESFSVGTYFASAQERFSRHRAKASGREDVADALPADMVSRLDIEALIPPASENWARRVWRDSDGAVFLEHSSIQATVSPKSTPRDLSELPRSPAQKQATAAKKSTVQHLRWVYESGKDAVVLEVVATPKRLHKAAGLVVRGDMDLVSRAAQPYAEIGGISYEQYLRAGVEKEDQIRRITGYLGPDFAFNIWARAADTDVAAILAALDYDGFVGLMAKPIDGVGNDVAMILPAEVRKSAENRAKLEAYVLQAAQEQAEREANMAAFAEVSKKRTTKRAPTAKSFMGNCVKVGTTKRCKIESN